MYSNVNNLVCKMTLDQAVQKTLKLNSNKLYRVAEGFLKMFSRFSEFLPGF